MSFTFGPCTGSPLRGNSIKLPGEEITDGLCSLPPPRPLLPSATTVKPGQVRAPCSLPLSTAEGLFFLPWCCSTAMALLLFLSISHTLFLGPLIFSLCLSPCHYGFFSPPAILYHLFLSAPPSTVSLLPPGPFIGLEPAPPSQIQPTPIS